MYTHCVVNHSVEYGKTAVVGGVTLRINTNHIEREWVEVRKALRRKPFRTYRAGLMRESYRQWFLSGLGADASRLQVLRDLGRLSTEGRERRQSLMGTKKVMFLADMKQKNPQFAKW